MFTRALIIKEKHIRKIVGMILVERNRNESYEIN